MTPNNYKDQFTEWLEKQIQSTDFWPARCAYKDALNQYRQLAPTWIPVTERLPYSTEEVLVHTNTGAVKEAWYMIGVWYGVEPYDLPITHWHKKPSPPINKEQ